VQTGDSTGPTMSTGRRAPIPTPSLPPPKHARGRPSQRSNRDRRAAPLGLWPPPLSSTRPSTHNSNHLGRPTSGPLRAGHTPRTSAKDGRVQGSDVAPVLIHSGADVPWVGFVVAGGCSGGCQGRREAQRNNHHPANNAGRWRCHAAWPTTPGGAHTRTHTHCALGWERLAPCTSRLQSASAGG
jgi:hypothetical protein